MSCFSPFLKIGVTFAFFRGQGGCEGRIEVFVKIKKKNSGGGGGGGGVRMDVNKEFKFL